MNTVLFVSINLLILITFFIHRRKRVKIFFDPSVYLKTKRLRFFIRIFILFFINLLFYFSTFDPSFGFYKSKNISNISSGVIMIDNSTSMLASDLLPSRFEVSRLYAKLLINEFNMNYALILFSSFPFIQIPFTDNIEYINFVLGELKPDTAQYRTSHLLNSLKVAIELLNRLPESKKFIFIFSDMEFFENITLTKIEKLDFKNISIYFFIVGTEEGSKIYVNNKLLKDRNGNPVITKANENKIEIFKNFSNIRIMRIEGLNTDYVNKIKGYIEADSKKLVRYVRKKRKISDYILLMIYFLLILYLFIYTKKFYNIDITSEFSD